ncbi:MAG TPA: protein kinase [Vicinamibacteria bacterium]
MAFEQIGKYKIVGKIGHGAMGDVFKAHDPVLNRHVAIKTIAGSLGSDEQFRKRFHREAQSAAALTHRNIVTVFEFAEEQGMVYMVMELLEGTDLKDMIVRKSIKRLEDKLSIVEQMCDGLAFAHGRGVVHRDLKPANIHVLANGTVKIMDFGLARLGVSEITRTGTVMGTPNYMSPEQVRGEKVDARSDIFSIGAVMYEVLAGHKPFEAETMHSVLFQVLDQEPAPLRQWIPDIPLPVSQVVEKALTKEPQNRYQSAGEMRTALRNARRVMAVGKAASAALQTPSDGIPPEAETTLTRTPGAPATFVMTDRREWAVGATALDLAPATERETPRTTRPDPTVLEAPEVIPVLEEGPGRAPWLVGGAVVALVAVGAGGFLWWRSRTPVAQTAPAAEIAREQEGILREQLVAGQVELAQAELDNKNYAGAIAQAEKVLGLDPVNASAQEIRGRAEATLAQLEVAAREARSAFGRGDTDGAARALRQVMTIDPGHPAANELKSALNKHFKTQAEEARAGARSAKVDAERTRARTSEVFTAAERNVLAADTLFGGGQFAEATQKVLEAGDGFARARRAAEQAELAAQRAAASPSASPVRPPSASPSVTLIAPPSLPPSLAPSLVPAPPSPLVVATPLTPTPGPASPPAGGSEPAIRRALSEYVRAVETKDLLLFKSVFPGLSSDQEKSLRESFKAVKSQQVSLSIESIEVKGTSASVRVSRQDTINGQQRQARQQTFRLSQRGSGWTIDSLGQ